MTDRIYDVIIEDTFESPTLNDQEIPSRFWRITPTTDNPEDIEVLEDRDTHSLLFTHLEAVRQTLLREGYSPSETSYPALTDDIMHAVRCELIHALECSTSRHHV